MLILLESMFKSGKCPKSLNENQNIQKKEGILMLNIYYGDMKESVYNTSAYFKYDYEDSWIVDPFVKEMIQDVDKSTVLDSIMAQLSRQKSKVFIMN